MVQAKLAGRKTQTRRIIKQNSRLSEDINKVDLKKWLGEHPGYILSFCPYGKVGDMLWTRESFCEASLYDGFEEPYFYKADVQELSCARYIGLYPKWKPSIHMPKAAARIWDEITDIRIERLQDISGADAIEEGVKPPQISLTINDFFQSAKKIYQTLWEQINGPESWEANPWVWVIETKNLSLTGRPKEVVI